MFFDDLSRYHDFYKESEKEILSYSRFTAYSAMIVTLASLFIDISVYGEYRFAPWRLIIVISSAIMFFYDIFRKKCGNYRRTVYFNVLFHLFITISIAGMVLVILTGENFVQIYRSNIAMTFSLVVVSQSYFISKARKFFYISVVPPIAAMTNGLILNDVSSEIWLTLFNFYVLVIIVLYLGYRKTSKDIKDFYETKKRNEEVLQLKESCIKDDLISNLSHELRTPLMGIVGIHELIMEMDINEEQKNLLFMSKESAYQLLNMINDLLEVSASKESRISLKLEKTELCSFSRQLFERLCSVKKESVEYIFRCNNDAPLTVMADSLKLGQILNNIIGNACKFTETGSVLFEISKSFENDEIVEVVFSVKDTGIGIPNDKIHKIFDRFYQVDSSISKKYKGTGIGLSIVKMIVDLMGGSIDCKSIPEEGSEFSVKIRFAKSL